MATFCREYEAKVSSGPIVTNTWVPYVADLPMFPFLCNCACYRPNSCIRRRVQNVVETIKDVAG